MAVKFQSGKVLFISYTWLSDASGNATISMVNYAGYNITAFETVPGLDGDLATTLPTNLYNVVINDSFSCDIAATTLTGRSGTVAELVLNSTPIPIFGPLSIVVSSAGTSRTGLIMLALKRESH